MSAHKGEADTLWVGSAAQRVSQCQPAGNPTKLNMFIWHVAVVLGHGKSQGKFCSCKIVVEGKCGVVTKGKCPVPNRV